jgi:hypothetical protein
MLISKNSEFEELFEHGLIPFKNKSFLCKFCDKSFKTKLERYKHKSTCIKSVIIVSIPQKISLMKTNPKHLEDIPIKLNHLELFSNNKDITIAILKNDFYEELSSKKKIKN